jgi:SNF2 family DNA or RNA helicase
MVIKPRCEHCNKLTEVISDKVVGNKQFIKLACGHYLIKPYTPVKKSELQEYLDNFRSIDGKSLRPYQKEAIEFGVKANGRVLFAHEMGLGKTILDFLTVDYLNLYPCLIVCKAGLREQIAHEFIRWCGTDKAIPLIIFEPRYEKPYPDMFKVTIVSFDSLHRCAWHKDESLLMQFKSLIIDETQQIKNTETARTTAVMNVSKFIPHVIASSGTPIKNNAVEYFPILNIIKPERFRNKNQFIYRFVDTKTNGKGFGGLLPYAEDEFRQLTQDFIIRRTRAEVAPDLPSIDRQYSYHPLGAEVAAAYQNVMKQFMEKMEEMVISGREFSQFGEDNLLGYMAKMRHLTGLAKINPTLTYIEEFLLLTSKKIVIFCHHHDVANILMMKLSEQCKAGGFDLPLNIVGLDANARHGVIQEFRDNPNCRILIASTLASGEGLNLQFCDTAVILEREWNPANEEQAEARFTRIGSEADKVTIVYPVAMETIDEFLASMVEEKRQYMNQILDGKKTNWKESDLMKELADKIYAMGLKKFKLK